jgi:hypothetical protein
MLPGNWKLIGRVGLLSGLLVAVAAPRGQADENNESGKLEGVWFTEVTARVCGTTTVLRSFSAINTFNKEQTMIDTTAGISPAMRSPGMGKWEKTGPQTYSATSIALLFNPLGAWTGTQTLRHVITVNGNENSFDSTVEIKDPAGNVLVTGCAIAVGHRM